jgi:hypothetical protein
MLTSRELKSVQEHPQLALEGSIHSEIKFILEGGGSLLVCLTA